MDTNLALEAVLGGAVAANQPEYHVVYADFISHQEATIPVIGRGALNGGTDVTLVAAPSASPKREIHYVSIYNKDTASVTITVKTDDGTTERIVFKKAIAPGEALQYNKAIGWFREAVV